MPMSPVTIRAAMPADARDLRRLAELDARPPLQGPALVAASRGRLIAAIALRDGAVVADPFKRTAAPVALLRMQRELLGARRRTGGHYLRVVPGARAA